MIAAVVLSWLSVLTLFAGSARTTQRALTPRSGHRSNHESTVSEEEAADASSRPKPWRRRGPLIIGLVGLLAVFGPFITVIAVIGIALIPRLRSMRSTRMERQRVIAALPDSIELLVLVIHAGLTPHQAMELLAERAPLPARPAFGEVARRTRRGVPLADALHALTEEFGPPASGVADVLAMAERHGTPISQALEQLSFEVRERRQRQGEAAARRLPIRLSFPLVFCTLPSFVLVAIVPAVLGALRSLDTSGL